MQLLAIYSCILRYFVDAPDFADRELCGSKGNISYCSSRLCASWLLAARRPADAHSQTLAMRGDLVFSKTLNSPVDHIFTVKVQSVCQVFRVSLLCVYFPLIASISVIRGGLFFRLLARWRGYKRDELTVQPLVTRKKPKRDACCIQQDDGVPI